MKKTFYTLISFTILNCFLFSCSKGDSNTDPINPDVPPVSTLKAIKISTSINQISDSRATDNGFEVKDKIGLFVVNNDAAGKSTALSTTGNHVNNMCFTYSNDGKWIPDEETYWKDNTTKADFYIYYPHISSISDITAIPFSIPTNQSTLESYKTADFMTGNKTNVSPTDQAVSITANHLMSLIIIKLAAGNGFTEASLAAANINVKINGIKTAASINLGNSTISASGEASSITPYFETDKYKALIVPQSVEDGNLITVNVDGRDFNLKKAFTFKSGTCHKFTVTLSKTSNGVNVNISQWEDDGTDNGGTAE